MACVGQYHRNTLSERRADRGPRMARRRSCFPEPRREADGSQQSLLPRVQAAPETRRARRIHVPRAAAHVRNRFVRAWRAPEEGSIATRTLVDHADDGYLLAPNRRYRW